ncbi:hypothetical protein CNMCM5623_008745 [Aspergillus felis]|uniref:Nucleoside phosphorylase domain-containing protein n=1 Tax=Aspergillus felis TaxID=1287682 RepID=A0A8H6PJI8_9EURO|nr:hypothetical protein CNMCM5623_008745 [Aspergillus felis]
MPGGHGGIRDDKNPASSKTDSNNTDCKSGSTELTHSNYTVGWICALSKEQTAATGMLDQIHSPLPKPSNDPNAYTLGSIGKHNIVIACLPKGKYSTISASMVATWMVNTFPSIKVGLMVGIGGGIPPKVRLGDVVVSTPVDQFPGVVQWDMGKAEEGGNFKRTGALNNPPSALLTALTQLETQHEMHGSKIHDYLHDLGMKYPRLALKYTWSDALKDPLFTPEGSDRPQRRVHYGLIASGNQVVKDAEFRDRLDESLGGNVLCVEMEAAGLMNDFPCVVIRGICDYADSQKNKDWQEYAAAVAAAYAKELLEYVQTSDVDRERPVKDILGQVLDTVQRTEANIETLRSKLDRKEDLEVLNWLTPVDHGSQHSDFLKRRQSGTGRWFLESDEYQSWLNAKNQTLFCPGIPGAGKTILTAIVIDDLTARFLNDLSIGIAYVYCNFRRQNEQKVEDLLASLLKQLSQEQPALPDIEVFDLQAKCGVNIFATSRFIPQITERFKSSMTLEIRACDEDVREYLKDRILQSESAILIPVSEEIQSGITNAVDGMFLLAQLHFDSIKSKKSIRKVREAIRRLPKGAEAYNHAYEDAMRRIEGQGMDSQQLAKNVISWIVCAKRPLTTLELQHALAVVISETELDDENFTPINEMVSVCAGLVTVDERSGIIRLVHYTTQEYFQKAQEYWFPDAETDITKVCVSYLSFDAFESGPCHSFEEFQERLDLYKLYNYSAKNWGHHARKASTCTPLSWAAENGHEAMVKQLLDKGADIDTRDKNGQTPLLLAAANGYEAAVKQLLEKGADPDSRTYDYGFTPLYLATLGKYEAVVKQLLEQGADPDLEDGYGQTPLLAAAHNGYEALVKLLLEKGADPDLKDDDGQTALILAAENGYEAVVKLLLEKGADPDLKDNDGQTALILAAENGYEAVVKLLLDKGADIDTKDLDGQAPLSCAARNGHEAVVKQLLNKI